MDHGESVRIEYTDLRSGTFGRVSPDQGFGNRNSSTGEREVYWFASMNEATGSIVGTAVVNEAAISIIPGPSSLGLLGIGALTVRRRGA